MFKVNIFCCLLVLVVFGQDDDVINVENILPTAEVLRGKDPITIIFSSPVIKLGQDWEADNVASPFSFSAGFTVPGTVRWITTYICRFDPEVDWPSDLSFDVTLNDELIPFNEKAITNTHTRSYSTNSLRMWIHKIESDRTQNFTSNRWSSTIPHVVQEKSRDFYEFPPDGNLFLRFSNDIEFKKIEKKFELTHVVSGDTISIVVKECKNGNSEVIERCLSVSLSGDDQNSLGVDGHYQLALPQGTDYHTLSGSSLTKLDVRFWSLLSFKFPFIKFAQKEGDHQAKPNSYEYLLWLRHGLDPSTSIEDLKDSITINPSVDFTLTKPHASQLHISGKFLPNTQYSISFSANPDVIDGWKLPLQDTAATFFTAALSSFRARNQDQYFEPGFSSDFLVMQQNYPSNQVRCASHMRAIAATGSNIETLLTYMRYWRNDVLSNPDQEMTLLQSDELEVLRFETDDLFSETGLFLEQDDLDCYKSNVFKSSSNIGGSFFRSGTGSEIVTSWITDVLTTEPLEDAEVSYWNVPYRERPKKVSTVSTNSQGVVDVAIPSENRNLVAVVTSSAGKMNVFQVPHGNTPYIAEYVSSLFLDRSMFKPLDPLYLKGYLRKPNFGDTIQYDIPTGGFKIVIRWKEENVEYPVSITSHGTIDANITVPHDAVYGQKQMRLSEIGGKFVTSINFLIADPRIPIAYIEAETTEDVYVPGKGVNMKIGLKTYTGTGIENAKVALRWTLQRGSVSLFLGRRPAFVSDPAVGVGLVSPEKLLFDPSSGSEGFSNEVGLIDSDDQLITQKGSDGEISYLFNPTFENEALPGDTITVQLEYIDPTRALIQSELSVPVDVSEWQISLEPTSKEPLPTYQFGALVDLRRSNGLSSLLGKKVNVELFSWDGATPIVPDPETGVIELSEPAITACEVSTNGASQPQCRFELPTVGKFVLIASIIDEDEYTVSTVLPIGKTEEEWKSNPLVSYDNLSMRPDRDEYEIGDEAVFTFRNPFAVSRGFLHCSNKVSSRYQIYELGLKLNEDGLESFKYKLGDECIGSCSCSVLIISGRSSAESTKIPEGVTVGSAFDLGKPTSVSFYVTLNVVDKEHSLDVELTLGNEVESPGSDASVTIQLTDKENGEPVSGEIVMIVVDKSYLDMNPHPMEDLSDIFSLKLSHSSSFTDQRNNLKTEDVYSSTFNSWKQIVMENPYIYPNWNLQSPNTLDFPAELNRDFQITRGIFWDPYQIWNRQTPTFGGGGGVFDEGAEEDGNIQLARPKSPGVPGAPAAPPPMNKGNNGADVADVADGGFGGDIGGEGVRSNFVVTPFFLKHLIVPDDGKATVTYKLPDNLSTFNVRVYAVSTEDDKFGQSEIDQVSRKNINLHPSVPRITRIGDIFRAGVSVTQEGDGKLPLLVRVEVDCGIIDLLKDNQKTIELDGLTAEEVLFEFAATGYGTSRLLFSVFSFDGKAMVLADSFIAEVPVHGIQDPVFVATSMSLLGSSTAPTNGTWDEGLQLPDAIPHSGSLALSVGVGKLPTIQSFSEFLKNPNYKPYNGMDLVGGLVPRFVLGMYSVEQENDVSVFNSFMEEIEKLTDPQLGLMWTAQSKRYSSYVDISLNSFALHVANRLQDEDYAISEKLTTTWRKAVIAGFNSLAARQRSWGSSFSSWDTFAFALPGLGLDTVADISFDRDISLEKFLEKLPNLALSSRSVFALAAQQSGLYQELVDEIVVDLKNNMLVQGRTVYISRRSGSNDPDFRASSLGLEVLVNDRSKGEKHDQMLSKLSHFVGSEDSSSPAYYGPYPVWKSSKDIVYSMFALAAYDEFVENTEAELNVEVTSGNSSLLITGEMTASSLPAKTSIPFDTIDEEDGVQFGVEGTGEASVVAGMKFIPATISPEPINRGIKVEKIIQAVNRETNKPYGPTLTSGKPGDVVQVTIQISLTDYLQNVDIVDLVPGGIEPLDDNLFDFSEENENYCWNFFCYFQRFQRETKKEGVTFHGSYLYPKSYSMDYMALVVTEGVWSLPPAKAFESSQPEVMGLSSGGRFATMEGSGHKTIFDLDVDDDPIWVTFKNKDDLFCLESVPQESSVDETGTNGDSITITEPVSTIIKPPTLTTAEEVTEESNATVVESDSTKTDIEESSEKKGSSEAVDSDHATTLLPSLFAVVLLLCGYFF